jgi:ABC-type antimicrobial peptide transport system permease subunit
MAPHRFLLAVLGVFAFCALLLASLGLSAVVSYLVAQRTHEIGVRMALGAQRGHVLAVVMREGLVLAAVGIVVGLGVSLWVTRLLAAYLYEVGPHDMAVLSATPLILASVAIVAAYIPARRATRVDPVIALRAE